MRVGYRLSKEQASQYKCDYNFSSFDEILKLNLKRAHIVVRSLTALGSTIKSILNSVDSLKSRKVWIISINEGIDTKKQNIATMSHIIVLLEERLNRLKVKKTEYTLGLMFLEKRKGKVKPLCYFTIKKK